MKILKVSILMVFFVFLALVAFAKYAHSWFQTMSAPMPNGVKREITIPSGFGTKAIATSLKQSNIIQSDLLFRLYIRFLGIDNKLRPGNYSFSGKENLKEVIQQLLKGNETTVSVTIPEGLTIKRIASILHDAEICNINDFIDAASNPSITGKIFLNWKYIPENQEGLLFPETYHLRKGMQASEIVSIMMKLTKKQIDKIFVSALPMGLSQYEGCILASIIESEAALNSERELIASVFYNRLAKKQKLESCATVLYALGEHKSRILYEDLKIESPYNTYKYAGLPPTPISNFGTASLKAVANPAKTDYLYFVSDNQRGHTFSKTLNEHNKNRYQFYKRRNAK